MVTTNGLYSVEDIDVETAKVYVKENGFISAVGHEATAEILSEILESSIPMNRIQFQQEVGQIAIIFKLNIRPDEGVILNKEEIHKVGFSLKKMLRIE
ncbi:uncharacterized protein DUF1874 [Natranaerovirga pectinivora]|uniref:Uncharacterized protein DUF1874 n=1 Tax=Natranaerovirga pectinivora TaxID=682400 RepID=A0A4R3ML31_9FIRM|nr:uncharacterized protein DUF1874 [Natranaerovirga pectinivora]